VFKLDTIGTETVLHTFTGGADGGYPEGDLIQDPAGNLYGTTTKGGMPGWGVVFKLDTAGAQTVLHSFTERDGATPVAGLARDSASNLYGTTIDGGFGDGTEGFGVVFKVDSAGTETILHTFTANADGAHPYGGLVQDSAGNLYGTTNHGGSYYSGTVFKIEP
jgi:uncharacterized repeat protein (TIGR03803 family)